MIPDPILQVYLDGQLLPDGSELAGLLAGHDRISELAVLDGPSVTWGTESLIGQPEPATARLSLLDFSRRWATAADRTGLSVRLAWTGTDPATGAALGRTYFRGRIRDVALEWVTVPRRDGTTMLATRLDVTCSSLEVDLANRFPTDGPWPAEPMSARVARLDVAGVATAVRLRDYWTPRTVASVDDPGSTSVRDHLVKLYNTCGADRMVYNPDNMEFQSIARQTVALRSLQQLAIFTTDPTDSFYGQGAVVVSSVSSAATNDDQARAAHLTLDAAELGYTDVLTKPPTAGITRVELTYHNEQAGKLSEAGQAAQAIADRIATGQTIYEDFTWSGMPQSVANHNDELVSAFYDGPGAGSDWPGNKPQAQAWLLAYVVDDQKQGSTSADAKITQLAPATDEARTGVRAVTVESAVTDTAFATVNASDLLAAAVQEGGLWRPGTVTYDSRRSGGFASPDYLQLLLRGCATRWLVALFRSRLSVAGVRPVFSLIGGTITYLDRRWVVELTLAGWSSFAGGNSTPTPVPQHPIAWEQVTTGDTRPLQWGHTGELRPDRMHPAVSYEDMHFVGSGTAAATIAPDSGWDYLL